MRGGAGAGGGGTAACTLGAGANTVRGAATSSCTPERGGPLSGVLPEAQQESASARAETRQRDPYDSDFIGFLDATPPTFAIPSATGLDPDQPQGPQFLRALALFSIEIDGLMLGRNRLVFVMRFDLWI